MKVENQTVEKVLDQILKDKRLCYEIVDEVIIIRQDNRPVPAPPQDTKKTIKEMSRTKITSHFPVSPCG